MRLLSIQNACLVLSVCLASHIAGAQEYSAIKDNGPLALAGLGSFFIEGTPVEIDKSQQEPGAIGQPGRTMINQMHVQFMKPLEDGGHKPIVFVHGGGLTSKSWQTTPDGRMGWDEYFVRNGFQTFLAEQVSRGRSGFNAKEFNAVRNGVVPPAGQAAIFIPTDQLAWNNFRWGATKCTVSPCERTTELNPGIKFPVATAGVGENANHQTYNQVVPDILGSIPGSPAGCAASPCLPTDPGGEAATPLQMARLARDLRGAVLVGHSQSSTMPLRAALQAPAGCYPYTSAEACNVKGIVSIETGCFENLTPAYIETLKHIPILIVEGDFYPDERPTAACRKMMEQINGAGGDVRFAHLPKLVADALYPGSPGPIPGVEHMMMIGTESHKVADMLIGWLKSRNL